jgi:hypothetical protein
MAFGECNKHYPLPNIIRIIKSRRMKWAGHVTCMREKRSGHKVLVREPEGKRAPARPRHIKGILLK